MNLLNKFQDQYQKLWQYIIRPERTTYPESALGPEVFTLEGIKVKRNSFQLINSRGLVFYGSHFTPMELDQYPCLIYLHGNSSNQTQGMEYLNEFIKKGISLCTFDFSGCGNAQGEYVTLGYYEWMDVEEVYIHIKSKEKVNDVGIWGRSMGAVTALRYLKTNESLKVAVFDSPFSSLENLVLDLVKNNSKIPKIVASGALMIINKTIKQKANFDIYELNPAKNQAPFIQTPAFFIVASEDELIPPKHSKVLFESYKGPKKQIRVVPGNHNSNRPESTIQQVMKFITHYLKKSQKKAEKAREANSKIEKQVDFFNQDLLGQQQSDPTYETQNSNLNDIDFFAKQEQQPEQNNDNQFQNQFDMDQFTKEAQNLQESQPGFKFTDFFAGFIDSQSKSKKKNINDGYGQFRDRVEPLKKSLKEQNKKNKQQKKIIDKINSELSNHDSSFETQLKQNLSQYIWT